MELSLEQTFQKINGTVTLGQATHAGLRDARLRGFNIAFSVVDQAGMRRDYSGRVTNARQMEGSFRDEKGAEGRWTASKR